MLYTFEEIKNTDSYDPWWSHFVLRPFVYKLTWVFANYTNITPNQITIISFIFGMLSAYSFLQGVQIYLIIGAVLYEISFLLDCIDGRIARLKGLKSRIGGYLDIMTDITKYSFIIVCLVYSQYIIKKDISLFLYGYLFMSLELVAMTSKYVIIYHTDKKNTQNKMETNKITIHNRLPFLMKIKSSIDPENKLGFLPLDAVEAETIAFFIFPIVNVKLGLIIGSIILFLDMIIITIFNFLIKKE